MALDCFTVFTKSLVSIVAMPTWGGESKTYSSFKITNILFQLLRRKYKKHKCFHTLFNKVSFVKKVIFSRLILTDP